VSVSGESFAPDAALKKVAAVKGVQAVTGEMRRQITLSAVGSLGKANQIQLAGIDPATAQSVRKYVMSAGRFLQPGDTGNALVPAGVAELDPEDLGIGAVIPLMTDSGVQTFNIVGLVADKGNLYAPEIIVSLSDAQTMLNQPGLINTIEVAFQSGTDSSAVTADVLKTLGSSFQSSTGQTSDIYASLNLGYAMFDLLGFLALFLGAFLIFNTFRTVVLERRHDLGMLRAIGAARGQITQMILVESLLQGLAGTILGLLVGYLLAAGIVALMNPFVAQYERGMHLEIAFNAGAVVGAVILGLFTTLLAGYWPARAASRISPLEALRPSTASDVRRAARWGLIVGVVMMVLAVVMLVSSARTAALGAIVFLVGMIVAAPALVDPVARLFGPILTLWYAREGDLARGNLTRQPGRVAITASTLMIGLATLVMMVALVTSMGVFVTNMVNHTFTGDIVILPQTLAVYGTVVGADSTLADRLQALPETDTVASLRYASSVSNGQALEVLAIDPNTYPKLSTIDFVNGTPEVAYAAMMAGRGAIVNSLTATVLHVNVGSDLPLETPDGTQNYRVVGVANDILSLKLDAVYISQGNLKADFQKAEDVMILLNVKPGADKTKALADVNGILAKFPQFKAYLAGDFRTTLLEQTNSALVAFYALALLILIPAALGLLNTLTINVLERTREIGVVRAVGGSRAQVRRIVTAEALLLGLFGTSAGVLVGIAMSYGFILAFATFGWVMPYFFPAMGIVAAIVIGVLLTLFASILPARNAAKLDILRALQFE
ncbi:MAG TPA: FtsX-like permease family protein, partial [Aggregatilineales bacterium]|nr:FtsX-like permease family protein [Aggregatilineales bacterium]